MYKLRNEVLIQFWNGMLTLPRYEVLNATGISYPNQASGYPLLNARSGNVAGH